MIKKKIITYICIDPGSAKIGWCLCMVVDCKFLYICEYGKFLYIRDEHNTKFDNRFGYIYDFLEDIILRFNPDFIVLENNNFTPFKYAYAQQIFLRSTGAIHTLMNKVHQPIAEINNLSVKSIVRHIDNISIKTKDDIKNFIKDNKKIKNINILSKELFIFKKKWSDTIDSIFIAYSIFLIILDTTK